MKLVSCVYLLISINYHDVGYNDLNPSRAIDGCIRPSCSTFGPNYGYIRQEFSECTFHPFMGVFQMIVLTFFCAYSVLIGYWVLKMRETTILSFEILETKIEIYSAGIRPTMVLPRFWHLM